MLRYAIDIFDAALQRYAIRALLLSLRHTPSDAADIFACRHYAAAAMPLLYAALMIASC